MFVFYLEAVGMKHSALRLVEFVELVDLFAGVNVEKDAIGEHKIVVRTVSRFVAGVLVADARYQTAYRRARVHVKNLKDKPTKKAQISNHTQKIECPILIINFSGNKKVISLSVRETG